MNIDVRLPLGIMFVLLGATLVIFGLVSDRAIYAKSLGINLNLWWGLLILVLGAALLLLSWRKTEESLPPAPVSADHPNPLP